MSYKCIFFDLDHTLWDYETNSRDTLNDLYARYALSHKGIPDFNDFYSCFREVNFRLWDLYDRGVIDSQTIRSERFKEILTCFNAYEENICINLSNDYLHLCPQKNVLMPYALETLNYLSSKYKLTIVTNGFEEIQHIKLASGKLLDFFDHIITSQRAGSRKPSKEIFDYALQVNKVQPREVVMVGDNLINDIQGARNASICTVFFNPEEIGHAEEVNHEIRSLRELCDIL